MAAPLSPMACALTWLPDSLYTTCLSNVANNFPQLRWKLGPLPPYIKFDIYFKLYKHGKMCLVGCELCNLDHFYECLKVLDKRFELHQCFQALMDHGCRIAEVLSHGFVQRCKEAVAFNEAVAGNDRTVLRDTVRLGLLLGSFLIESAWYEDGERCINACVLLCSALEDSVAILECYMWLFEAYNGYAKYGQAFELYHKSLRLAEGLRQTVPNLNLAFLYCQFSVLFFSNSKFDKATHWSIESLKQITSKSPVKLVIDCCRQAAKIFSVRRNFNPALLMITHAMSLTRYHFDGGRKYPDTLLDYGLYLLGVDAVETAADIYQMALDYRQASMGGQNIMVAQAHEDLAYALYVKHYSTGEFKNALMHADRAREILESIIPQEHLLHASSRRVKALILEEIAIDSDSAERREVLLKDAKELHTGVLKMCREVFGEESLQTAKHYGNLGRLNQSQHLYEVFGEESLQTAKHYGNLGRLNQSQHLYEVFGEESLQTAKHYGNLGRLNQSQHLYEEAMNMHLRAIEIKERILGPDDYEVALLLQEAMNMHLRAIEIKERILGPDDYEVALLLQEAMNMHLRAIEIKERILGPDDYEVALLLQEAMNMHLRAIEIKERILGPDDYEVALLLQEAMNMHLRAIEIKERILGPDDYEVALLLQEAMNMHLRAIEIKERILGPDDYEVALLLQEAMNMHLRAIEIKERILGPDDYEVALSAGHLASLYNYDMERFTNAEVLYLRSVHIGVRLFGEGYSGLEYDYRGLIKVYENLGNPAAADLYTNKLVAWKELRDDLQRGRQNALTGIPEIPEESIAVIQRLLDMPEIRRAQRCISVGE